MWVVDYTNNRYYQVSDAEYNLFHTLKMEYGKIYETKGVRESFHETEYHAVLSLRKHHVDSSLKHLKRESELSKRIKELTTE